MSISEKCDQFKEYRSKKIKKSKDSVKLFNQPIAEEGVLEYEDPSSGKIIKKLKKWEDLKKNIGRVVPIVDEHPADNNGNGGLINKEKIYGYTSIKKCPNQNKLLCSDPVLEDNSPIKKGYSIGFLFAPVNKPGDYNGSKYDVIQSNLLIDHVALTNSPRSLHAVMVTGDSVTNVISNDNGGVNKYILQYDSFNYFSNLDQDQVNNMPKLDEIKNKIKKDNPDIDDAELEKRAKKMFDNAKDQEEEEEKKKKESDSLLALLKKDELIAEVSRLRAESDSNNKNAQLIKTLEAERDSYKNRQEEYKNKLKELLQKQVEVNIDTLVKKYNVDAKDFQGKNASFIEGATWMANNINGKKNIKSGPRNIELDSDVSLDINDYRYNHDSRKMERIK